jgi:hypothetical protein
MQLVGTRTSVPRFVLFNYRDIGCRLRFILSHTLDCGLDRT